jgi:hypothetical protein
MAKKTEPSKQEILADLIFMLEQSFIIEHLQDIETIRKLCKKYGVLI